MTNKIITVIFFLLFPALSFSITAQDTVNCRVGAKIRSINLVTDAGVSSNQAVKTVKDILFYAGKSPTLIMTQAAEVKNAAACLATDETPYRILFSPSFFLQLSEDTFEPWATTAILAHEVGHIINNHFVDSDHASTHDLELVADKFAGKILAKMGADLDPALAAFRSKYMQSADGVSYPSTQKRLLAVTEGWQAEINSPTPPNVLIEKNAKKLKNKFEELENQGFKLKPISFDLLGMKCNLEEVKISKNEANNLYECSEYVVTFEGYELSRKTLNEIVNQAFKGENLKNLSGSEDKFELLNSSSNLKRFSFYTLGIDEPFSLYFSFLFAWNGQHTLPYLSPNPNQTTLNVSKEIAANISYLESTNISNIKKSFKLIGMECTSNYDSTKIKADGSETPIRINFSCSSVSPINSAEERKKKLREIFNSVEYILKGKSYAWTFLQGDKYTPGESVYFEMSPSSINNRLDYISVSEEISGNRPTGNILLKFIILKGTARSSSASVSH